MCYISLTYTNFTCWQKEMWLFYCFFSLPPLLSQASLAAFSCSSNHPMPHTLLRIIRGPFNVFWASMYETSDCCIALFIYFNAINSIYLLKCNLMWLMCITVLSVKLFILKAALPQDIPFIGVNFTGILHICKFTIVYLYHVYCYVVIHIPGWW